MKKLAVQWKDSVVGHVIDAKTDMFDLYGKWLPGEDDVTVEFIKALESGEELTVQVGDGDPPLRGLVSDAPTSLINIRSRPDLYDDEP